MLFKKGWKKKTICALTSLACLDSCFAPCWIPGCCDGDGDVYMTVMYRHDSWIRMIHNWLAYIILWIFNCLSGERPKNKKNAKGLQGTEEAHAPEEKEEKQVSFRPSSLHSSLLANCQWANQPKSLAEKCSSPRYGEGLCATAFLRQMH